MAIPITGPRSRDGDVLAAGRRRSATRGLGVVVALLAAFSVYAIADGGFTLYFQRVIDGAMNGIVYGMVALALVLVFKATGVINFAQGAMGMVGTYLAFTAADRWAVPLVVAILLAMVVSAAAAAGIERVLIRPFDPGNHLAITIVTLALYLALNALAALIWGFDPRGFPTLFPTGGEDFIAIGGARLYYTSLGTALVVVAVVVVLQLTLARTRLGLAFRCVAAGVEPSRLLGIHIGRTVQSSWALAAAVGTLAGCLAAPTTYLDPTFMDKVLVYAFAAATLGGLDSIAGALVGGVVVGLSIALLTGYIPALGGQFGLGCAFFVIVAVLQFKPAGLLGRRSQERV
ncbi:branched-chain amino acid ABC transporter permease [Amycolatopsis thermophila]|uniref:Branched-chain amino acid transport system permease protein n=1 Tax=Amycolatopsis thermophila TaxID=206084 RepID=A0ABU0F1Y2_9PSEU|nr:branched-chain amino acid ABC transporter permease [Amycolatopsis thermophila]MDQ0381085.1 branched-chain amino acid transport system permease protein [Amycolatopsis thermophila]